MTTTTSTGRRSQGERSAATRQRLLDATVDCLIERGYAGTTTTEIVRRAGVSRGAQVHHFPTKAELVHTAIAHLAERQHESFRKAYAELPPSRDRVGQTIDLMWSSYAGPLFAAGLELIVAARTDAELRPALHKLNAELSAGVRALSEEIVGEGALQRRPSRDAIDLTFHLMGGMALAGLLDPPGSERVREAELLETWKRAVRPLFATGQEEER